MMENVNLLDKKRRCSASCLTTLSYQPFFLDNFMMLSNAISHILITRRSKTFQTSWLRSLTLKPLNKPWSYQPMSIYQPICVCVCLILTLYTHLYIYMSTYMYMNVYIFIYVYVYIYS